MNRDQWLKIIPIITTIFFGGSTLWLTIKQRTDGNKAARREDYKFAKQLFDDLEANPKMHPFARMKGFQAFGNIENLPPSIVEHLMKLGDPMTSLSDYETSRGYLRHTGNFGSYTLDFSKVFFLSTEGRRKALSISFLIFAAAAYIIAFTPWFLFTVGMISGPLAINATIILLPSGLAGAIVALREFIQLRSAMRLIRAQTQMLEQEEPEMHD